MVEERLTDGYRIAELLASEIDGRRSGPIADLAVANADRTVEGTPAGERAYDIRLVSGDRDPRREPTPADAGELFGRVYVHETGATLALEADSEAAVEVASSGGLETDESWRNGALAIRLEYGAQSKRAIDALEAALAGREAAGDPASARPTDDATGPDASDSNL
jgi:hypothetical protein